MSNLAPLPKTQNLRPNIFPIVRISNRARRISLKITPRGELVIVSPRTLSTRRIDQLLQEYAGWISKHKRKVPEVKLHDGAEISIYGDNEKIVYAESAGKRHTIEDSDAGLIVRAEIGEHEQVLKKWLLKNAKQGIIARVEELAEQFGFKYNKVAVRDQGTRWGSCSAQKNLNFSWRLMLAPLTILDYVIIHELAHTKQMNHSDKFWKIVQECMPDYRTQRKWLRENGTELHFY